ncbi:MAG: hypothetical protein HOO00_05015, partial [Rhodospirillaceae bacterium]|nr:hypothetical protein [Rhodospirillaceae bacterium]
MFSILTLNTFLLDLRLFGWLPLYRRAPYVDARLDALTDALCEEGADVICLQEVFRPAHRKILTQRLGRDYPHAAGATYPGGGHGTGLMIFSRHPFQSVCQHPFRAACVEEKIVTRPGVLEGIISISGLGPVKILNMHLTAGGLFRHPESIATDGLRARQLKELLQLAEPGNTDEAMVATLLAGDLNAGPHTSQSNYRQVLNAGFTDTYTETGGTTGAATAPAYTWDPANPVIWREADRRLPPQRIDHV